MAVTVSIVDVEPTEKGYVRWLTDSTMFRVGYLMWLAGIY